MIKRISAEDLEIGMYVTSLLTDAPPEELMDKGFIKRRATIQKLSESMESQDFVLIDTEKGKDSALALPYKPEKPQPNNTNTETEKPAAKKIYKEALFEIHKVMSEAKYGKQIDIRAVEQVAGQISRSISRNPFTLLNLTIVNEESEHLFRHSISCGVIMGIFTQFLGFSEEESSRKVTGALLHDIGKTQIPSAVQNQTEGLSKDDMASYRRHIAFGQAVLAEAGEAEGVLLEMLGLHHEQVDGKGFPLGKIREDISLNGHLMAIVNEYDNLTSAQAQEPARSPSMAIKNLREMAGQQLDIVLANEFIKCFGIYPPGSLVELSNGRVAAVIVPNNENPDKPFVKSIFNIRQKCFESVQEIDLASKSNSLYIVDAIDPKDMGIKLEDFL